jgi:hypothetical protein
MVAYDEFAMASLLADTKDTDSALAQDQEALSSFQKLAAADPANAQFQIDIAVVRSNIGDILLGAGKPADALEPLRLSAAAAQTMADAKNPKSRIGFILISDQFLLGKANVMLASSAKTEKAAYCREASAWFQKCLPGFEFLRDHAPSGYKGADRVTEIHHQMSRCEK